MCESDCSGYTNNTYNDNTYNDNNNIDCSDYTNNTYHDNTYNDNNNDYDNTLFYKPFLKLEYMSHYMKTSKQVIKVKKKSF